MANCEGRVAINNVTYFRLRQSVKEILMAKQRAMENARDLKYSWRTWQCGRRPASKWDIKDTVLIDSPDSCKGRSVKVNKPSRSHDYVARIPRTYCCVCLRIYRHSVQDLSQGNGLLAHG